MWPRPWATTLMLSRRFSIHLMGCLRSMAAKQARASSAQTLHLLPNPAADFGRDHANVIFGQVQLQRQLRLEQVRDLGRGIDQQFLRAFVIFGDDAARFNRRGRQTGNGDAFADDDIGGFKGRVGIAPFDVEGKGNVVVVLGVNFDGAVLERFLGVGDRVGRLVFDLDLVDGVLCHIAVTCDDRRDRVADVIHAVLRQDRMVRYAQRRHRAGAGNRADFLDVLAGIDSGDAGQRRGFLDRNARDLRGRVGTAQDRGIKHPGTGDVVDVGRRAGDQTGVFGAPNALPHITFGWLELLLSPWFSPLSFRHGLGGRFNGFDNVLIAGTATEIAFNGVADFVA